MLQIDWCWLTVPFPGHVPSVQAGTAGHLSWLLQTHSKTPAGADLANLLNEAAILTGRRNRKSISLREIDDSVDRIVAGMEGKPLIDGKAKSLVAYHEVGHAICGTLTPGHDAVQKVTLIPRGQARGLTWFQPGDDPTLVSKQQMFARIVGALGGRAAEEVIFGSPEVTTGASSDLQMVTQLAKQMVINYGFSDIGPWSLMDQNMQQGDMIMRMMARNSMSEALQVRILHRIVMYAPATSDLLDSGRVLISLTQFYLSGSGYLTFWRTSLSLESTRIDQSAS